MGKYTASDFANARFAEHPDGSRAFQHPEPSADREWETSHGYLYSHADLTESGWVPVPTKPTITQSVFDDLASKLMGGNLALDDLIELLGIEVTPDPEPTNAEKLAADLREIWDGHQTMNDVVQWLNDNDWVKANE